MTNTAVNATGFTYKLMSAPECWSDGLAVHGDAHYLYRSGDVRISGNGNIDETWPFPGLSFTFGDAGGSCNFVTKAREVRFDDLRVLNGATITFGGMNMSSGDQRFVGDAYLDTAEPYPLRINNGQGRVGIVAAALHGKGWVQYRSAEANADATVSFRATADNGDYLGATWVLSEAANRSYTLLAIADETNLGGNPRAFDAKALFVSAKGVLRAEGDCVIDDANRGVTLGPRARVDVDAGKTLTLGSTLALAGDVTKGGEGTLVVATEATAAAGASVAVTNGQVRVTKARAFGAAAVAFSGAAAYAADAGAAGDVAELGLLALNGLSVGETLTVWVGGDEAKMTAPSFTVPLFTVPTGQADALAAKLQVKSAARYADHSVARQAVVGAARDLDGVSCKTVFAQITPKPGLLLIFR